MRAWGRRLGAERSAEQEFYAAATPRLVDYLLKYIQADSTIKTTVIIHNEESLIPVFLAMRRY